MLISRSTLLAILLTFASLSLAERDKPALWPNETRDQRDARMKWWREARFGMFIHWGLYAQAGGYWDGRRINGNAEWLLLMGKIPIDEYLSLSRTFNPTKFDADTWVRTAKDAGMRYIVITAKHHDGFAMYPSKFGPHHLGRTLFQRDPLRELAEACRRHGVKLGFYYSHSQDWTNPGGVSVGGHWDPKQKGDYDTFLEQLSAPQVDELLTNYGDDVPAILWWDLALGINEPRADLFVNLLKKKPGIISNDRLGYYDGDYATPEQYVPSSPLGRDFETCMTITDNWGHVAGDPSLKSLKTIVRQLVDSAAAGGNYLLNVGPDHEGVIPGSQVQRLAEVGAWLELNGESIYGTSAGPFRHLRWGRSTSRGSKTYLHVYRWPTDGRLLVPIRNGVRSAKLLASDTPLVASDPTAEGVVLQVPMTCPDPIDTVIELTVEGEIQPFVPVAVPSANGVLTLTAADAELVGKHIRLAGSDESSVIGYWHAATDFVRWRVRTDRAREHEVRVTYACLPQYEGARFEVRIGESSIAGLSQKTPGWDELRTDILGIITIPAAGEHTGEVRIIDRPTTQKAFMNLQKVELIPVPQ